MSPLYLQMLLHFHCIRVPFPNIDSPAQQDCLDDMLEAGLVYSLSADQGVVLWRLTPRGNAHVLQLLALPLPTQAWIGADGKVIEYR